MVKWRVQSINVDDSGLITLLNRGWEPFAVSNQGVKIWLKKPAEVYRGRPKSGKKET